MTRSLPGLLLVLALARPAPALEPIPDGLVVLTFDDASKSHHDVARPLLLKYKFGATFFVCEGWDFATNKKDYMTWEEIGARVAVLLRGHGHRGRAEATEGGRVPVTLDRVAAGGAFAPRRKSVVALIVAE